MYMNDNKEQLSRQQLYYLKHRQKLLERSKEYQIKNKEIIKQRLERYYSDPIVYKRVRQKDREGCRIRTQEIKQGLRPKRKFTLQDKIRHNLRNRLLLLLKKGNVKKTISAINLLGCTIEDFKYHIEQQFLSGMTWENHGIYRVNEPPKWHFEHIMPCSAFDLSDINQQKKCFHYTNLRPFWGLENIKKGGIKKNR